MKNQPSPTKRLRTVFMGTPDFAVPSLRALADHDKFEIVAVVTQPDRPAGRNLKIAPSPVKALAVERKLPILQPDSLSDIKPELISLAPDIIVVVAYAQILPEDIISIPRFKCINVHASLLPKYRGASCIQSAILNGEKETGATIMLLDKGLDTGPILSQIPIDISDTDTTSTLTEQIAMIGANILPDTIIRYVNQDIIPHPQDNSQATYVGLIKKEDGRIDWNRNAEYISRQIRAFDPWPGTWTELDGKKIKILEADSHVLKVNTYAIGEVFGHDGRLAVQCGQNVIIVNKLQLEGKKAMDSKTFLLGYKEILGKKLA